MDQPVRSDFESRTYAITALVWLLAIAGLIAVLDATISTDKPIHAGIAFVAGVAQLVLAAYLRRTSDVRTTIIGAVVASGAVYLGDFVLYGDAYYFAIGFSVPIGAALFLKSRYASIALAVYTTSGMVIAILMEQQAILPQYESAGIVGKTAAAIVLMSLTTLVTMWKERLLAESQRMEWKQRIRFDAICDNAYGAFFEADSRGMITFARGSFIDELGYSPEDLLGRNQFNFLERKDRRELLQLSDSADGQQVQYDREISIHDAFDRQRWVRLTGGTSYDETGKTKWIYALQDIQEVVNVRQKGFDSSRLESLSRVCGGLAHDFNNLLTVMKFHGEAIADPQIRSEFQQVQQEAANLTSGMLTFARDRIQRKQEVALSEFLTNARPRIERPIPANILCKWTNQCEGSILWIDPAQLQQVLINLVTNACHSMPCGGNITIAAEYRELSAKELSDYGIAKPEVVRITVSDDGTGMNAETASRATEPFFTTKPRGKGTGLGLSTVHGAVRQAGGAMEISSEAGKGTEISILLPAKKTQAESVRQQTPNNAPPQTHHVSRQNVALVEDRPSVAQALRAILESYDYAVNAFPDAEQAWSKIQNGLAVDFLISDITLPGMSGIELAEKAIANLPDVRIVLISGNQNNDLSIVTQNPAKVRFVAKPFGSTELLNAISAIRHDRSETRLPSPHLRDETSNFPA